MTRSSELPALFQIGSKLKSARKSMKAGMISSQRIANTTSHAAAAVGIVCKLWLIHTLQRESQR